MGENGSRTWRLNRFKNHKRIPEKKFWFQLKSSMAKTVRDIHEELFTSCI